MKGFRIGGTVVNNLWHADDTVIVAVSEEQLKRLINLVVAKSEEKGLHLNSAKSFSMVFSKLITTPTCHIDVHWKILKQVQSFIYLGNDNSQNMYNPMSSNNDFFFDIDPVYNTLLNELEKQCKNYDTSQDFKNS